MIFKQCIDITDEMLRNHQKYVKDYYCRYCGIHEGEKIDIKNGIIEDKSFISENLSHACFHNCEFENVDFKAANLDNALFFRCTFKNCSFEYSNCHAAKFKECNFNKNTNFHLAVLVDSSFEESNISKDIFLNPPLYCPSDGEFIAWKKAYSYETKDVVIVKLLIPKDAKRVSWCGQKCRTDKALVLDIQSIDGKRHYDSANSMFHDDNFKYILGEWVKPKYKFDNDRTKMCASGIHFFINKSTAENY